MSGLFDEDSLKFTGMEIVLYVPPNDEGVPQEKYAPKEEEVVPQEEHAPKAEEPSIQEEDAPKPEEPSSLEEHAPKESKGIPQTEERSKLSIKIKEMISEAVGRLKQMTVKETQPKTTSALDVDPISTFPPVKHGSVTPAQETPTQEQISEPVIQETPASEQAPEPVINALPSETPAQEQAPKPVINALQSETPSEEQKPELVIHAMPSEIQLKEPKPEPVTLPSETPAQEQTPELVIDALPSETQLQEQTPEPMTKKRQRTFTTLAASISVSFKIPEDLVVYAEYIDKEPAPQSEQHKAPPRPDQRRFTFSERLNGWELERRKRSNGRYDTYFHHQKSKSTLRSTIEVRDFIMYEIYPEKMRKDNKGTTDIASSSAQVRKETPSTSNRKRKSTSEDVDRKGKAKLNVPSASGFERKYRKKYVEKFMANALKDIGKPFKFEDSTPTSAIEDGGFLSNSRDQEGIPPVPNEFMGASNNKSLNRSNKNKKGTKRKRNEEPREKEKSNPGGETSGAPIPDSILAVPVDAGANIAPPPDTEEVFNNIDILLAAIPDSHEEAGEVQGDRVGGLEVLKNEPQEIDELVSHLIDKGDKFLG